MIDWTNYTKELRQSDVIMHQTNASMDDLNDSELPTDIHIVYYFNEGKQYSDAVRAGKMSSIFDVYHDRLRETGGRVVKITNGHGKIKPKLYQGVKSEASE